MPATLLALFAALCLTAPPSDPAGPGDEAPAAGAHDVARVLPGPRGRGVGTRLPDLRLTRAEGGTVSLSELVGQGPLVLSMREVSCPLSNRITPKLARLEQDGVRLAYLDASPLDGADEVLASAERLGLTGPQLVDPEGRAASRLGVLTTTEVLVIDGALTLRYRGAVDDQHGLRASLPAPRRRFLEDALAAVAEGRRPEVLLTAAPGCVLDLPAPDREPLEPTWHRDVSRLVQDRCQACHRGGGPAPFALETADDLRGRKGMVAYVTAHGIMPPWGAAPGSGPWLDDRSLSEDDQRLLLEWLEAGAPDGDPDQAPLPRRFPERWSIGEPDVVYAGQPIQVPAEGVLDYHYYYVKTDQPEDRWVEAVEILPGATTQVHHVLVFVEDPPLGQGDVVSTRGRGGLSGYFAGYIPGQGGRDFGEGFAKKLPAGAWLKFQMHYTTNGVAAEDVTRIGLRFAEAPPEHELRTSGLAQTELRIPPRTARHEVSVSGSFKNGGVLAGFSPHMHLRGRSFRYELERPDGTRQVLLDVPDYDFDWQTMYRLAEPVTVPPGSKLHCSAVFDNSADNPANPDPSATVWFGEQTWDEMMIGYFEWWTD